MHMAQDGERVKMSNNYYQEIVRQLRDAADEMKRLRKERDEARREVCGSDGGTIGEAMLDAEQRGWDCFKDASDDIVERLRAERDEARREVCHLSAELDLTQKVISNVELIAEEYGWDCFKENTNE